MKITIKHPTMGDFSMEVLPENLTDSVREKAIQHLRDAHKGEVKSYCWIEDNKTTLFSSEFLKQCVVIIED